MRGLERAVEIDRGLNAAMAEHAPYHLVVSGISLEDENPRSMAELMNGQPKPCRFKNALYDLGAEQDRVLTSAILPREQPIFIVAAKQGGTEVMDIFVDQFRKHVVQWVFQGHSVLDIVVWEHQPIICLRPARLDQVHVQPNTG